MPLSTQSAADTTPLLGDVAGDIGADGVGLVIRANITDRKVTGVAVGS